MVDNLIGDWYQGDGDPDWSLLQPPFVGAIIKATEGTHYDGGAWFQRHWPAIQRESLLRGCYHYVSFGESAEQQLDFFLRTVDRAGGWGPNDLIAVDVERGGQRVPLTAQLVIDTTTTIARGIHEATGIPVILYGGELIRSLNITDHMGCSYLWTARYAATLPASSYTSMGWHLDELVMWQYCGKETATRVESYLPGYPSTTPCGPADISVLTMPVEKVRQVFCVT